MLSYLGGLLVCLYPWWADATVDFMISGGYNVSAQIQLLYTNLHCHLNQQMLLCRFVQYIQKRNPCYKTNGVGTTLKRMRNLHLTNIYGLWRM